MVAFRSTSVAPLAGDGDAGVDGDAAVVKLHSGPWFAPAVLCATICQKYVVPAVRPAGVYDAVVSPLATCDGGSVGPNRTSYVVAPSDAHVSVTLAATPAAPLAGDGVFGVAGGAADVVNDQTDPVVDP